jgi:heptosyltransferase-2
MSGRLSDLDRVLVRTPSWLGDFVMAEPVMRALCEWGGERVTLAGPPRFLELLDGRFAAARRKPISGREPEDARSWRGFDFAILLNGSFRSAWTAFTAGIPSRAGFARGGRSVLLTHAFGPARECGGVPAHVGRAGRYPRYLPRPFGQACVELATWLGLTVRERTPRLTVFSRARDAANQRLAQAGLAVGEPFVLVNAGARPDSAKGFPPDRFASALDACAASIALPFVLACGPGEEANARRAAALVRRARIVVLDEPAVGLPELVFLSSAARLAITTDSGPRHLAQAFETPTVVLCGPTDPRHTAEHPANVRVLRVSVPCGPCHRERCPLAGDQHHACMKSIEPVAIARAADVLLAGRK